MNVGAAVASLALLGAACSEGSHTMGGADAGPGGDDGDGGPVLPRVTVRTGAPPALIAFRDEASAAWTTPTPTSPGVFEIEVTGPYRVVVACESSGRFTRLTQYARAQADEHLIEHSCGPRMYPFNVHGQMLQEGVVFLGGFGVGESPAPWTFDLSAAAGTFDFIMLFGSLTTGSDQVAIRRDLTVAGDLDLGTIDVANEHAQALIPARFTAPNVDPAESLGSRVFVQIGHTFADEDVFDQPAWDVRLFPDAAFRAGDTQEVDLMTTLTTSSTPVQQRFRNISHQVHSGGPTSLTLMDPVGAIAFERTDDRLVATWASLPAYDELDVWRESFSTDFSRIILHESLVTRAFVEVAGAANLALDFTDVPGFRPEWRHDPTFSQVFGFDASARTSRDDIASSGVSEDHEPPPATPSVASASVAGPGLDARDALRLAPQFRRWAKVVRAIRRPDRARGM